MSYLCLFIRENNLATVQLLQGMNGKTTTVWSNLYRDYTATKALGLKRKKRYNATENIWTGGKEEKVVYEKTEAKNWTKSQTFKINKNEKVKRIFNFDNRDFMGICLPNK